MTSTQKYKSAYTVTMVAMKMAEKLVADEVCLSIFLKIKWKTEMTLENSLKSLSKTVITRSCVYKPIMSPLLTCYVSGLEVRRTWMISL